jgi:UDP-N-acetylglucosamine acyltransferase
MCFVGPNVKLDSGCRLIAQCHITGYSTIGKNNTFFPFSSIGTQAEDYEFDESTVTYLKIGDNNIFREGVTINSGTKPESETVIGNGCFFMANAHVAHNCKIGNKVIMVVDAGLAGYCEVGDNALISGMVAVHQFCRIGRFSVLSGGTVISKDMPPFMIAAGRNRAPSGLNLVGLKRNNFPVETIRALKDVYKIYFLREVSSQSKAIEAIKAEVPDIPEVREFIEFVESSKRGILK